MTTLPLLISVSIFSVILTLSLVMTDGIINIIKNSKNDLYKGVVYIFIFLVVNEYLFGIYKNLIYPLMQ